MVPSKNALDLLEAWIWFTNSRTRIFQLGMEVPYEFRKRVFRLLPFAKPCFFLIFFSQYESDSSPPAGYWKPFSHKEMTCQPTRILTVLGDVKISPSKLRCETAPTMIDMGRSRGGVRAISSSISGDIVLLSVVLYVQYSSRLGSSCPGPVYAVTYSMLLSPLSQYNSMLTGSGSAWFSFRPSHSWIRRFISIAFSDFFKAMSSLATSSLILGCRFGYFFAN